MKINWGEPQRAPQLRVDLAFRHSRYLFICLFESTVRPLGFVAATLEPKSRANLVLRHCLPLALIDNDFLSDGTGACAKALFLVSSPSASGVQLPFETNSPWKWQGIWPSLSVFHKQEIGDWRPNLRFRLWSLFLHPVHGCAAVLWDKLALEVPQQALGSSFPVFHTQEIDDWSFDFDFGDRWLAPVFRQCSENMLESIEKTTNARNWICRSRVETGELEPWVAPPVPCTAWHAARDGWHLLERARLPIKKNSIHMLSRLRLAPQCLHSPSSFNFPGLKCTVKHSQLWKLVAYETPKSSIYEI